MRGKLSEREVQEIRVALKAAREGTATLKQIASAIELAERAPLNGVVGELRSHVRRIVPGPVTGTAGRDIFYGVLSGVATHFVMKWAEQREQEKE